MSLQSVIDYDESRRRYLRTGRFQPYIMPLYPQPAIRRAAVARAPRYNPLQIAFDQGNRMTDAEINAAYDAAMQMRAPSAYSLAPTAAQQRVNNARIGGYIGIEKKYVDYVYQDVLTTSVAGSEADPATALALNAIAQGDDPNQRNAREVTLKSVHMRGFIDVPTTIVDPDAYPTACAGFQVKLALILDTQTNGAQFNAEDVFVDATGTGVDTCTFRNLQFQKRFRVLKDLTLTIPHCTPCVTATTSTNETPTTPNNGDTSNFIIPGRTVPFEINHEFKGTGRNVLKTLYNGTGATVSTITDNSLHVICLRSAGYSNSTDASLRYYSRVRYVG